MPANVSWAHNHTNRHKNNIENNKNPWHDLNFVTNNIKKKF